MKLLKRLMIGFHIFVGIGALAGGLAAILNPYAPMGMSAAEALNNSPFHSFLIPGLLLFGVIGLGNLFSAFVILRNYQLRAYISGIFSGALVIWIIVQCLMLQDIVFLHVLYLCIGLIQAFLAALLLLKNEQFPANLVIKLYQKLRKQ